MLFFKSDGFKLALALVACLLAFHHFSGLALVGLAALSLGTRHGSAPSRIRKACLWGALYAGLFHVWILFQDPLLWCLGLILRGGVWGLLVVPSLLIRTMLKQKELVLPLEAVAWGVGLALVTQAQISTSFGFDWEIPLVAFATVPALLVGLPWLGLPGLSGAVGVIVTLMATRHLKLMSLGCALLVSWLTWSLTLYGRLPAGLPPDLPSIGLVQTGWTQRQKWDPARMLEAKLRLFHLTETARRRGAQLVVWPETAWPQNSLHKNARDRASIADFSQRLGVEILASALDKDPTGWKNSVYLVTPDGGFVKEYHKRRLVPIREYVPAPESLEQRLRSFDLLRDSSRYRAGVRSETFTLGQRRYACLICYESTTPEPAADYAEDIDFLVVVTNGATLRSEFAKEAHFRSAILRAIQFRKPVFQASNDGVTGVIDSRGAVVLRGERGYSGADVLVSPDP